MTACHFKMNESSVTTIIKKEKEICEAVAVAMPAGMKTLHFCEILYLVLKMQLLLGVGLR